MPRLLRARKNRCEYGDRAWIIGLRADVARELRHDESRAVATIVT